MTTTLPVVAPPAARPNSAPGRSIGGTDPAGLSARAARESAAHESASQFEQQLDAAMQRRDDQQEARARHSSRRQGAPRPRDTPPHPVAHAAQMPASASVAEATPTLDRSAMSGEFRSSLSPDGAGDAVAGPTAGSTAAPPTVTEGGGGAEGAGASSAASSDALGIEGGQPAIGLDGADRGAATTAATDVAVGMAESAGTTSGAGDAPDIDPVRSGTDPAAAAPIAGAPASVGRAPVDPASLETIPGHTEADTEHSNQPTASTAGHPPAEGVGRTGALTAGQGDATSASTALGTMPSTASSPHAPPPTSASAVAVAVEPAPSPGVRGVELAELGERLGASLRRNVKFQSLSLQLHPEELGAVRVEARLVDGVTHLVISPESSTGGERLAGALRELRHDLARAGVDVGDLDLRHGTGDSSTGADRHRRDTAVLDVVPSGSSRQRTTHGVEGVSSVASSRSSSTPHGATVAVNL